MFDIGFFEILVIAVVALLVLGPEKMPHAVRMVAAYWGRLKRSIIATKVEIEDQLAIEDIRKQLRAEQAKVQKMIDQVEDIKFTDVDNASMEAPPKDEPEGKAPDNSDLPATARSISEFKGKV